MAEGRRRRNTLGGAGEGNQPSVLTPVLAASQSIARVERNAPDGSNGSIVAASEAEASAVRVQPPVGAKAKPRQIARDTPRVNRRVKHPFNLSAEVLEMARDCVWGLNGTEYRTNLSRLAEEALRREITRLSRLANDGEPFPRRGGELAPGRPLELRARR